MSRDVRNGMPVSTCNDAKHYQICRFVVGEIFNVIPFAPIVSHYLGMLENLLNDPVVLAGTLIGWLIDCKAACSATGETANIGLVYNVCAGLYILDLVGRSISTIQQIADSEDLLTTQSTRWCDELEDWQSDLDKAQQQGERGASAYGGLQ